MVSGNLLMMLALSMFVPTEPFEDGPQGHPSVTVRNDAHETLFKKFAKRKSCVYSEDKTKLVEVFIHDETIRISGKGEIELPEDTAQIVGMFDYVVLHGENLKGVKAALNSQAKDARLKLSKSSEGELAVFQLVRFPWARSPKLNSAKEKDSTQENDYPLVLKIECQDEIVISKISLFTTKDLFVDFAEYQKSILQAMNRLEELSSFLSKSTDESDRSFARHTMGATAGQSFPIRGFVNDRRVAKIYAALSRLDNRVAEAAAVTGFDREFEAYAARWSKAGILPNNLVYGVKVHLFLCSEFCSAEIVLNKIDQWEKWHAVRSAERGDLQFLATGGLDRVYAMNLHMNLIMRDRGLSIDEMNALLAVKLGPSLWGPPSTDPKHGKGGNRPPRLKLLSMVSSDAGYTEFLAWVPMIEFASALGNPIREEALRKILRDELLGESSE